MRFALLLAATAFVVILSEAVEAKANNDAAPSYLSRRLLTQDRHGKKVRKNGVPTNQVLVIVLHQHLELLEQVVLHLEHQSDNKLGAEKARKERKAEKERKERKA